MTWTQYPKITPPQERFWGLVDKSDDCWLWSGGITPRGYGTFGLSAGKSVRAHRYSWELEYGPIPDGITIDHECHNQSNCKLGNDCPHRKCVRPSHLRARTLLENNHASPNNRRYQTRCIRGHEFSPENTVVSKRGRACRTCKNACNRSSYHNKKKR